MPESNSRTLLETALLTVWGKESISKIQTTFVPKGTLLMTPTRLIPQEIEIGHGIPLVVVPPVVVVVNIDVVVVVIAVDVDVAVVVIVEMVKLVLFDVIDVFDVVVMANVVVVTVVMVAVVVVVTHLTGSFVTRIVP